MAVVWWKLSIKVLLSALVDETDAAIAVSIIIGAVPHYHMILTDHEMLLRKHQSTAIMLNIGNGSPVDK